MGRNSPDSDTATVSALNSIRDRFPFKRTNSYSTSPDSRSKATPLPHRTPRSHHHHSRRRLSLHFPFRGKQLRFYLCIFLVIFSFALASMVLQSSITSVFRQAERIKWRWSGMKFGSSLEFVPRLQLNESRLDWLRSQPRIGIRPPRICLGAQRLQQSKGWIADQ